ncbi:hypothetical protein F4560_002489 [Saccharothrix ecbatanensis]|uniref:SWIM-type domain-containing protein n=1 Tax=Saccharothrix ecbatanensis TaxID=1105145 RepID=A0A7W9M0C2_9PSEU|nr:hypothetical protein [Saccharothrix ecbatanensis]MBB5802721.1 hypothetical protein [Saccharothrix ecbatanensis]
MTVPPVSPVVVADVLDALPPRLRKRVDASLARVAEWTVTVDGDTAHVALDAETTLTWTLHGGALTSADDLACSCLLAPKCLHRGIAVSAADIASDAEVTEVTEAAAEADTEPAPDAEPASGSERAAAAALWDACATVLRAGATGSGAVVRAGLLRAVHTARVAGLYRASANGLRIAAALAAARAGDSSFDRELLTAELVDLMLLCQDLRTDTGPVAELRGTARREYRPIGSLRLYGLCTEVIVSGSGYSGVVTHLVDADGVLWTVPAIMPGGAERISAAASGPVAIGESGLSQRELGRAGLLLSGGTASPDHRLGAGKAVRAVAASAASWTDPPLAGLWAQPLPDQVSRAFQADTRPEGDRPAGADLLFLDGTVLGTAGGALRVATDTTDVDLVGEGERARENLRLLASAAGVRLRFVARLLPDRPGTAVALAVAGDLDLPGNLRHHVDLGLDRLQRSHVAGDGTRELPPRPEPAERVPRPVRPLENVLHRVALGGRAVAAISSADRDVAALTRTGLTTTADVLADLAAASRDRGRDAFGRVVRDTGDDFPFAWLRAGLHVREFTRAAARQAWLPATHP